MCLVLIIVHNYCKTVWQITRLSEVERFRSERHNKHCLWIWFFCCFQWIINHLLYQSYLTLHSRCLQRSALNVLGLIGIVTLALAVHLSSRFCNATYCWGIWMHTVRSRPVNFPLNLSLMALQRQFCCLAPRYLKWQGKKRENLNKKHPVCGKPKCSLKKDSTRQETGQLVF